MSVAKIEMLSAKAQYIICMKIRVNNFAFNYVCEQEQMEPRLNFQVPAEGLELVILLNRQC